MQMASALRGGGGGMFPGMEGLGGMGGGFPAPGVPGGAAADATSTPASPTGAAGNGTTSPPLNPFALFGGLPPMPSTAGAGSPPPFGMDPALMQQLLGAGPFGGGMGGGMGGFGAPAAPVDSRPPEERFQVQLQVLPLLHSHGALTDMSLTATTGYGLHQCVTECPCSSGNRWQRTFSY